MIGNRTTTAGVLKLVGNTPLIRVRLFEAEHPGVEVYGKAEWFNPGGSVKDRAALAMIEDGERRGVLAPGKTIIDSTSGNTGIAYAMVGAAKGYPVKLVMPSNVSEERKQLVTAYGAEIVYSDPLEGSDGAIRLVRELVGAEPGRYFYPDQYSNPANPGAHYHGTGVEILEQTGGRVTHFVAGLGTSGTFVGTARRLKETDPAIQTIAVMPEQFHGLEGLKHLPSSIVPPIWDPADADLVWESPTEPSYELARQLCRREGLLVGHSSGAALWAIGKLLDEGLERGVVVTVFPDGGDRYLSTGLYRR